MRNSGDLIERFIAPLEALPTAHRGPVLLQLPPNQGRDVLKLDVFLGEWRERTGPRWRMAVEFRSSDWIHPEVYRVLDRHRAALCLHDMPGQGNTRNANDAPFVYVRRHGTAIGRYDGPYSPEAIEADAHDIRRWRDEGRSVWVYYNNDIGGHAFHNALELQRVAGAA